MSGPISWRPISSVPPARRERFAELVQARAIVTRARVAAQDEVDRAAHAERQTEFISASQADRLPQQEFIDGLARLNEDAPLRRVEITDSPIDPWLWSLIGKDERAWEDGTFVMLGRFNFILSGIEFDEAAAGLFGIGPLVEASLATAASGSAAKLGGRPSAEWWDDLWVHLIGRIYHVGWQPRTQAEIVADMQDWLTGNGFDASESTLKPRARKILAEFRREPTAGA